MKKIPLTQGKFAIVDEDDYDELVKHKWCATYNPDVFSYYAVRTPLFKERNSMGGKRNNIRMHRVVMGEPIGMKVDHKNHDTLDNRKVNLRICTNSQNGKNIRKHKGNRVGFKGVCIIDKIPINKYRAKIKVNYKDIRLGYFPTAEEAAIAYNNAAIKYFGEFAHLNVIP